MIETTFGYLAAFCTTASFLPQVIKVFKTKHTKDISLGMFLLMTAGVSFWLVYGLLISSPPIIMANTVTVVLSFYILFMKVKLDGLNMNKLNGGNPKT
ncbi:MAG TPA: SemiSWEET transporter [Ignavibacteriaceae bacterium]|nr:SemiSWEET transporter [Ignavibacteriaceae bacterium]